MDIIEIKLKSTKCKCPKCEKYHFMKLIWTGKFMPRKFCKSCVISISKVGKWYNMTKTNDEVV